ncbi:MAG: dTDP-4-dehydrorhamnose reductase [Deltaproteobacteria bacterium]|nr:dTDP-4-dehydrorhamnose reductase [Deltaproteobacteria bacterium]
MMKILLTGSGGQLGSGLKPMLEAAGHAVAAPRSKELDIIDREMVFGAVTRLRPDIIINCAAYTLVDLAEKEREEAEALNRTGPANIAAAAADAGAKLIHISTDFVFDGRKPLPYTEEDATNPLGVYGETKLAGEEEIRRSIEGHMIVRTSWLYGIEGQNFVKTILRLAGERELVRVVYDQAGTPTWAADLAGALVDMARSIEQGGAQWGLYHYSNEGVASWYDFAVAVVEEAVAAGFALKCKRVEPILTAEYPTPARRPAYSVLDKAKIKKTFNMTIPHWRVSLRGMIKELSGG